MLGSLLPPQSKTEPPPPVKEFRVTKKVAEIFHSLGKISAGCYFFQLEK
jgi:hypothetical protein